MSAMLGGQTAPRVMRKQMCETGASDAGAAAPHALYDPRRARAERIHAALVAVAVAMLLAVVALVWR